MRNNSSDFKPIYIHWYEDDFQADLAVRHMTSRQRSFYRNLLMYAYFGDKRPYLTADDTELWLIADADTQQEWLDNKKPILTKFTERMTKDGPRLVNKRVLEEWQIIEDYLAQRKKAGLASAAARRRESGNSNPEIPTLIVHPATTVEHPLTADERPSTGCQQAASSLPTNEDEDRDVDRDADGDEERDEHQQQIVDVDVVDSLPETHAQEKEAECRKVKTLGSDGRSERPTDGEIIAEYRKVADKFGDFNTTEPHRKAGIAFFTKHGRAVALAAFYIYLSRSPRKVRLADGREECRTWRFKDFLDSGDAEVYAEDVRPIVECGVTSHEAILTLCDGGNFPERFDGLYESDPGLAQSVLDFLNEWRHRDSKKHDDAYYSDENSDCAELFDYLVKVTRAATRVA